MTFPLDIIDDRPAQKVLEDILVIQELPLSSGQPADYYYRLSKAGTPLVISRTLTENRVNNGDTLDLESCPEESTGKAWQENSDLEPLNTHSTSQANGPLDSSNLTPDIPGKKIEFD